MKIDFLKSIITVIFVIIFTTSIAKAAGELWYPASSYLKPVSSAWGLQIPALAGVGNRCAYIDADGKIMASVADCGTSSMVYPAAGIALSTGSAWGTSITDNSVNWNTAYGWGNHADVGYATTTITGNAGTATALLANGANCNAGNAPLGVDASGAAEGCFAVVTGTPWTGMGYLTSLNGAVLTDQSTPQTIGLTGARLAKLWATDIEVTNAIAGSITGNAGTASALAADPADCGAGAVATAIAASGALTCSITPLVNADIDTVSEFNTLLSDGDFLTTTGKAADADTLDTHDTSYFQTALTYPVTGVAAPTAGVLTKWGASGNAIVDGLKFGTMTDTKYCTYSTANGLVCNSEAGSMTYPGAGVAVSNGSAWTTSLATDGSGDCASGSICMGDHTHSSYLTAEVDGSTSNELPTAGNYIDVSGQEVSFDPTEITGGTTWDDGGEASVAWTWNLSAGDPTLTFGNDLITSSNSFTITTGKNFKIGTTQWNSADEIDGTKIKDADYGDVVIDAAGDWQVSEATALAADPADCAAGTAATAINASGTLTCGITPLISGGTLTNANVCQYDGTGIDCNLTKDGSGDCASGAVCLGDHTHSGYQAADADLTTWAGITPGANVGTFLATPSSANFTSALTDEDGTGTCGTGAVCIGGHTHPTTELSGVNAGSDLTADLEEEAHAAEHAVSAADTVFPADPNADRYLQWDDDPGTLVWAAGAGGLASTDIDTSAELLAILTDETGSASGTPLLVFNTNPVLTGATLAGILADNDDMVFEADADNNGSNKFSFTDGASGEIMSLTEAGLLTIADDLVITGSDLSIGAAGVKLTGDGDGAITFLGMGDGADENFVINLDDTENKIVFSSGTSADEIQFSGLDILVGGGNINTGNIALTIGDATTDGITFTTDGTGNGELTLPADSIGDADIDWGSGAGQIDLADIPGGAAGANAFDFGGASDLEIPNGASVTDPNAAGEVAIDTTSGQLLYHDGTAQRVMSYKSVRRCFGWFDPADADDDTEVWIAPYNMTVTNVECRVSGGTSIAVVFGDGTNNFESITCDADSATDDGSITNATFTDGEAMEIDLGAPSGTVPSFLYCIDYTIDAD